MYSGTSAARLPLRPWYHVTLHRGSGVYMAGNFRDVVSALLRSPGGGCTAYPQRSFTIARVQGLGAGRNGFTVVTEA